MDQLMNSYIQTLMKHDPRYGSTKRNVIVVLTKADLINHELPSAAQSHLADDPIVKALVDVNNAQEMGDKDMEIYMNKLKNISDETKEWVKDLEGGRTLVALAANENIELRFCLVSSTGGAVDENNRMKISVTPTRVLDPFFWALEFQSKPG
jgi:hypothetical protein